MRWIALKWITRDLKVRLSNPEEATDGIAEGLVSCATDSDLEIRGMAVRAITTTTAARKDLLPYLVDALGDDAVKAIAVSGLEWRIMRKGDGPTVSATAEIDVKVEAWKDWWRENGWHNPEFKRFVPSATQEQAARPSIDVGRRRVLAFRCHATDGAGGRCGDCPPHHAAREPAPGCLFHQGGLRKGS
jgi:hypothetical protein